MKIITNTAALLRPEEGKRLGITVLPVSVVLKNRPLRDYIDIGPDEFSDLLHGDDVPVSSQPSVGEVMELLETSDEETILLTVGDGLSGEYMTAMGVRNTLPHKEKIHIIDSGSLAGPLHYMALKAARLRDEGFSALDIARQIRMSVRSSLSYVIPADLSYLKRSGRITNLTLKIGSALKLLPVLTQTEDRHRITLLSVKRTWRSAVGTVLTRMKEAGVNENFLLSVGYADRKEQALQALRLLKEQFPKSESELIQLPPSLITHGGPGCVTLHAVRK